MTGSSTSGPTALSHASLAVCSLSVLLNAWIFYVLRGVRYVSSASIYNLLLIRHLLMTDAVTALLVIADLSFKQQLERSQRIGLKPMPLNLQMSNFSNPQPPLLLAYSNATSGVSQQPQGFCLSYLAQESLRSSHSLTLFTLTLIAIDLYLFINRNLSYRTAFVVRYMRRLLIASWAVSALLALLPVLYHGYLTLRLTSDSNSTTDDDELLGVRRICHSEINAGFSTAFCCVGRSAVKFNSLQIVLCVFAASCAIVTFCYSRIIATIYQVMRLNRGDRTLSLQRHNRRGVLTAMAILLQFYVLFLPFFIAQFATNLSMGLCSRAKDWRHFESLLDGMMRHERLDRYLELLMVAYTLLNPLLYACRLSAVRRHSTRTLTDLKHRTRVSARQLSLRLLGNRRDAAAVVADRPVRMVVAVAVNPMAHQTGPDNEAVPDVDEAAAGDSDLDSDMPRCTFPASVSLATRNPMKERRFAVQLPTTFP